MLFCPVSTFCHVFTTSSPVENRRAETKVDQQRYPVLLTEPPYNPTAKREKMVEVTAGQR